MDELELVKRIRETIRIQFFFKFISFLKKEGFENSQIIF